MSSEEMDRFIEEHLAAEKAGDRRLRSYGGLPTRRTNLAPSDSLKNSNQTALHRSFARDVKISTVSRAAS
jgi:hypothetical protein